MNIYSNFLLVFFFAFQSLFLYSQVSRIDSLELDLKNTLSDTAKVDRYASLCWEYRVSGETAKAIEYGKRGVELAQKIFYQDGLAQCFLNLGTVYLMLQDNVSALIYYQKANNAWEPISESSDSTLALKAKKGIATVYGNIGLVYQNISDFPKSLDYHLKSLKIKESLNSYKGIARTLGNIGVIYSTIGDPKRALEYQLRSLAISEKYGLKVNISGTQSNIGLIYFELKEYALSLLYQQKSLEMAGELGDKGVMASVLGRLGSFYANVPDSACHRLQINPSEKLVKALEYQHRSYVLNKEIGSRHGMAMALGDMGSVYLKQGDYNLSIQYAEKGLDLLREIANLFDEKDILYTLYKANKALGRESKALDYYEKFVSIRDVIFKEENQRGIMKKQMDYEFEKKENAIKAGREKERALAAVENQRHKTILWFVMGGMLLLVVFSVFIVNRWSVTRRQKAIIEKQKVLVDEKNQHITESIYYAKRIQESILVKEEEVAKILPFESFIFYQPKDIVSGDFYWLSHAITHDNKYIIAAADCTGHGVPGAFLSMIGNMLLNQIVNEKKVTHPSEILKGLHQGIYNTLRHETESLYSHDGMDIALCTLNVERQLISYAGANNPLYVIDPMLGINVIKADSISLGDKIHRADANKDIFFSTHEIPMQKGMRLYLFSDGFMDQYRKKDKRRIGSEKFKQLLLESAHLSMQDQKKYLMNAFNLYKGADKQVDDVLVIGIKI